MSKRFCFTSWGVEPTFNKDIFNYLCYGKEIAPETKKEHWQGYVEYHNKTAKKFKKISIDLKIEESAHIEKAIGDFKSNKAYCSKEGKFKEFGAPMRQGCRNDLACITDAKRLDEIPTELLVRYSKGITFARNIKCRIERKDITELHIVWGPPGVGKSRKMPRGDNVYWKSPDNLWWDGYENHEIVILDDWNGTMFTREYMLRLIDSTPLKLQIKGGFVEFNAKKVYITSNYDPKKWYNNDTAWLRRITTYEEMKETR